MKDKVEVAEQWARVGEYSDRACGHLKQTRGMISRREPDQDIKACLELAKSWLDLAIREIEKDRG